MHGPLRALLEQTTAAGVPAYGYQVSPKFKKYKQETDELFSSTVRIDSRSQVAKEVSDLLIIEIKMS